MKFEIKTNYNYSVSTEENYQSDDHSFHGKYMHERSVLDYTYHKHYSKERQLLQDDLIDRFLTTYVYDKDSGSVCSSPLENWIVFTAGPMGAGKGHTMAWLASQNLFPTSAFVYVDPDRIRALLPEIGEYNRVDPQSAGYLTQKEVGYISEIMTYDALRNGKNVLVDGSLRDARFYLEYFTDLRKKFPILKVAIINITAKIETVLARAKKRALVTGRTVPESMILEALHKVPESLEILSPIADFVATFNNDDDSPEPILYVCSMKSRQGQMLWKLFYEFDNSAEALMNRSRKLDRCKDTEGLPALMNVVSQDGLTNTDDVTMPVSPFTPATISAVDARDARSGTLSAEPTPTGRSRVDTNEGSIHSVITEGITSNRLSVRKSKKFPAKLRDLIKGVIWSEEPSPNGVSTTKDVVVKDSESSATPRKAANVAATNGNVIAASPKSPTAATDKSAEDSVTPQTLKSNSKDDDSHPGYLYVDYVNDQMECVFSWKDLFRDVWVMHCAPPNFKVTTTIEEEKVSVVEN